MEIFQKIPILIFFFFIAIGAYILVYLLKNKFSKERYINLCERIKTWLIIIVIFYLGSINRISMLILFAVISYLSVIEFFKLFDIEITSEMKILSILIIGCNYLIIYRSMLYVFYFFVPCMVIAISMFVKRKKETAVSFFLSIYLISFIAYLVNIKSGISLIVGYVILIELNDVYQYITGNIFGKRKIVPRISPSKGVVLTTVTILFFNTAYGYKLGIWMGPIISIFGFLGDILISYFKRKTNKKDSGTILAGHGGILDRVDSLILNSPVILLITLHLHILN